MFTITIDYTSILYWAVLVLTIGGGVLGLISWFVTGQLKFGFLGIATFLPALLLILGMLGIQSAILATIVGIASPLFYVVGFIMAMKGSGSSTE